MGRKKKVQIEEIQSEEISQMVEAIAEVEQPKQESKPDDLKSHKKFDKFKGE